MIWLVLLTPKMKHMSQCSLSFSVLINLIIYNYLCLHPMAQTEISKSFFTPFSSDDDWKACQALSSNYITNCGTSIIFGGLNIFDYQTTITKTFILPPHYKLKIEFKFWRLTPWSGSVYNFYIDGFKAYNDNPNTSTGTQICGIGTVGEVYQISREIDHNGNSAIATLISHQVGASWGISDFIIYVQKCPEGCDFCDLTGNCQNWNRVLAYFNTIFFSDGQGWERDNFEFSGTQQCGSIQVLQLGFYFYGQFLMSEMISIELNLPDPHTKYKFQFKFLCAYITGSITIKVQANNVVLTNTAFPLNIITTSNNICGSYFKLDKIALGEFFSTDSILTITIEISAFSTVSAAIPFYGIRDFELFTDAEKKQVLDGSIICNDGNIYAFDGCFSSIYDCHEGCNNCVKGLCTQCLTPWKLNTISGQCLPNCGDQIVVPQEECDDGNQIPYDGCYECKFSCPLNCISCQFGQCLLCNSLYYLINNQCEFTCYNENNESIYEYSVQKQEGNYCQIFNFLSNLYIQNVVINTDIDIISQQDTIQCTIDNYGIFAYQYNICYFETSQNCKVSFLNICQICQDNFQLNNNNLCIPECGNGIVQEYEFCDDANIEQFDGCYQCQSNCQLECLQCSYSQCFQCIEGWNLIDFKCVATCGDGLIALLQQEQCDDQNDESNDGCFECKLECSQNCQFCNKKLDCVQCEKYFEIKNYICVPICGDGIVVEGFEQCDDGNNIQYDGCYECQFSCKDECQICNKDKCLDDPQTILCEIGYQLIDNQCHSICGDSIITSNEQCDDANEIPFDGCYQCQFSCSQQCLNCIDGQCLKCELDYEIQNNICIDICGNGSKSELEECDDNNQVSQDGCSDKCEIEINWQCTQINFKTSQCLQMKPPKLNLIYLNQTNDSQFIQLQITSKVKLQNSEQNFTDNLKFSLIDLNPQDYIIYDSIFLKKIIFLVNIISPQNLFCYFNHFELIYIFNNSLTVVEPNDTILKDINYLFQIQLLKQETSEIYFQVQFDALLIDEYGFQVENQFFKLHLRNTIVLTESQRIISNKICTLNIYILIGLGLSSFIILLSGNPGDCFEVLDTMQYQSNLKYINSKFPENVMIYFESSQVVTIIPILEKLKILELLDNAIGSEQIKSFGKFLLYDVNSDLITNLSGLIVQIGLTLVLLIASKIYLFLFFKKYYNKFRIFICNNSKFFISSKSIQFIHKLNKLGMTINQILSFKGLVYVIQANSWDLLFKTLIYLYSKKENNLRNYIQNILAYSFITCILMLISQIFSQKDSQIDIKKRKSLKHEGVIVAKKLLFLIVLIGSQESSLTQSFLISLINSFYLIIIILGRMVSKKIDLILILMFEIPVILFTLLNITYEETFAHFLSLETQVMIGFGQIGLLLFGIMAPLIKYGFQIYIKLKQFIQNWKQQKIKQTQPTFKSLFI